jgi:hypothetical protein
MKIRYFPETDTLVIELSSRSAAYTELITEDLILDYDPAIALYTKLGVREDVLHFDIAVDVSDY